MTQQDKHIIKYFEAVDKFRDTLSEQWLAEAKGQREWLERDIKRRDLEKSEALQGKLFH